MCFFSVFWDIEREVFVVSAEKHWHGCQNWILALHRSILRTLYWKNFCVMSDLSRKLSKFQLKRWNKSVGIELFFSTRIIWEKLEFLKKNKLSLFSQFEPNFLDFWNQSKARFVEFAFNISRRKKFLGKIIWSTSTFPIVFWAEIFPISGWKICGGLSELH